MREQGFLPGVPPVTYLEPYTRDIDGKVVSIIALLQLR